MPSNNIGCDYRDEDGTSWKGGPFTCSSTTSGLRCNTGDHGFTLTRYGVKTY